MKDKRGISHIEIVISFALFIGLLVVIFLFIQPVREPQLSSVVLDIAESGLRKDARITLVTLPFKTDLQHLNNQNPESCFTMSNPLNLNGLKKENIFIKDKYGNLLPFNIDQNTLTLPIQIGDFYYIHFSFNETFPYTGFEATEIIVCYIIDAIKPEKEIVFSTPRAETLFSFNKLNQTNITYYNNYAELKRAWFIPEKNDFSITVKGFANINMQREIPQGKDVFARELTMHMIKDRDIGQIDINIKIW